MTGCQRNTNKTKKQVGENLLFATRPCSKCPHHAIRAMVQSIASTTQPRSVLFKGDQDSTLQLFYWLGYETRFSKRSCRGIDFSGTSAIYNDEHDTHTLCVARDVRKKNGAGLKKLLPSPTLERNCRSTSLTFRISLWSLSVKHLIRSCSSYSNTVGGASLRTSTTSTSRRCDGHTTVLWILSQPRG
jgi:hypothetical protein